MQLEFHQLDRRWEHLRARRPHRQRRLMASLAESGQQTPIVVVLSPDHRDRYLVIDGHKRIAALQQLGRDTVEAVVWPMGEAEALLLDRSLRFSEHETALEQGWLLAEMEQRFGYGLDELAHRFDRSVSWVSRRLALVELLPEAIQQQVREGKISAQWCDKVNSTYKKHIRAVPRELFAVERLRLKPLPAWIPEVYRLHQRMVDIEGYVALHTNRYSVPVDWIGRRVEVRETKDKIEIQRDARNLVTHTRIADAENRRIMLAQHRPPRGQGIERPDPHPEEKTILEAAPEMADYVAAMKQRGRKAPTLALRQLLRLVREYPREPLLAAVREAARYGLYDLDRLERMILRRVVRDYFLLDDGSQDD